jgi:thymidine kinase
MKKQGYLEVIAGPMYSGKTELLIERAKRATYANKKVQVFKHDIDTRYGKEEKLYSHAGLTYAAKLVHTASDIQKKVKNSTYLIGIDEAQWFGEELIPIALTLVSQGKYVVIAGLGLTYERQPFIPMPSFMSLADKVTKLTAVCMKCGKDAIFHKRVKGDTTIDPLNNDPSFVTTLDDKIYEARCRNCFDK